MKKVLVTGGAGFIGTNLIKKLVLENYHVTSIDNYSTGLQSNHQNDHNVIYKNIDIRNITDYSIYGKFDIVYHLAAMARIQPSFNDPIGYFNTNASSVMVLTNYCVKNNIPLVYSGSSSHHSGKFKNPYTFSKDIGEDIIKLFQIHYGLKSSICRFYNVYGPHQLTSGEYCTLIGSWENRVRQNLPLLIYGDGSKKRDFTHVHDIVDALYLILKNSAWGYTFEFGRGKNYSISDIAKMFGKEVEYLEEKKGEAEVTLCSDTLAKDILGWNPKLNVEDYIKNLVENK